MYAASAEACMPQAELHKAPQPRPQEQNTAATPRLLTHSGDEGRFLLLLMTLPQRGRVCVCAYVDVGRALVEQRERGRRKKKGAGKQSTLWSRHRRTHRQGERQKRTLPANRPPKKPNDDYTGMRAHSCDGG